MRVVDLIRIGLLIPRKQLMLFVTHTNLMWYPEHLSDEFVEFA